MSKKSKKKPKKRKRIATVQAISVPNQLRKARGYPIKECYCVENWQEIGMADVFILREKPDHRYVLGIFLVDVWCLGLKDTTYSVDISYEKIMDKLQEHPSGKLELVTPDFVHSLIYGAIKFARQFGFSPHSDFKYTKFILEPEENIQLDATLAFGKNGKPYYMPGPYESEATINRILLQLEKNAGEGNYYYAIPGDNF